MLSPGSSVPAIGSYMGLRISTTGNHRFCNVEGFNELLPRVVIEGKDGLVSLRASFTLAVRSFAFIHPYSV